MPRFQLDYVFVGIGVVLADSCGPLAFVTSRSLVSWSPHAFSYSNLPEPELESIRSVGGPKADTYGEMTARGFRNLAAGYDINQNDSFLDLGSGQGALVLQAAQEYHVRNSVGIELSQVRHESALRLLSSAFPQQEDKSSIITFVCGDAAGEQAAELLHSATVVWVSNLLFGDDLQCQLAINIGQNGHQVRLVASLKAFPGGIRGFEEQPLTVPLEMSWTAGKEQPGHPPLPGHPCFIYLRTATA